MSCHLSELIATLDKTTSLCLLGSAKRQSKAHCDTRPQALRTVVFLATSLELKGQSRDCKASCHFRLCAKVLIIGSTASLEVKMPETVNFAKQTAAQISPSVRFPTNNYVLEMLLQVKPRCSSHCSRSNIMELERKCVELHTRSYDSDRVAALKRHVKNMHINAYYSTCICIAIMCM